jgi:hypothetical protein
LPALAIKEYKYMILKNGEEVAKLISIVFYWIWIAP